MLFANKKMLLVAFAIIVLLIALGFYISGRASREVGNEAAISNISKSPVSQEVDGRTDKDVVVKEDAPALTSSPATGAGVFSFFFLIPTGILGWSLRKYTSSRSNTV